MDQNSKWVEVGIPGADVWVAVALGSPLLLLAIVFFHSRWLQLQVSGKSRKGVSAPARGSFWQLPLLGETLQLLRATSPDNFMLPRIKRYGSIFRSHLMGNPTICVTTAESNKFVLQSPSLFIGTVPKVLDRVLGEQVTLRLEGDTHTIYRRVFQAPLTPESLKQIVWRVDDVAKWCFQAWGVPDRCSSSVPVVVNTLETAKKFTWHTMLQLVSDSIAQGPATEQLLAKFIMLEKGITSTFPFDLPGTVFSRALKARKELVSFIARLMEERRAEKKSVHHDDILDSFLNSGGLTDVQMLDNIIFVLLAGSDTSTSAISWVIYNLCSYPTILQEVKAENDAVAQKRKSRDDPVTWDELKQLPVTMRVLQESLRTANVAPFVNRKAAQDIVYNGTLIPKGWHVSTWFRYVHLDPKLFPDPLKFDPDRFKTPPKANTFTPFGNGPRVCPGSEMARLQTLVFVHRLIVTFDFEAADLDPNSHVKDTHNWMFPRAPFGAPIKVSRRPRVAP